MTDLFGLFKTGIFGLLKAGTSGGTALVNAGVTGVYPGIGPAEAVYPYITYQMMTTDEGETQRRDFDGQWLIECWDQDEARAESIAGVLDGILQNAALAPGTGYACYRCRGVSLFSRDEVDEGFRYYRRGRLYRIRIDQS